MKKTPVSPLLDKALFEAGQQCAKRLYLEYHGEGEPVELSDERRLLAETGQELVQLACQAFPKGVEVQGEGEAAALETRRLLEQKTPILFRAAFRGDAVEARTDILLRNGDGSIDLFEVKSGTKVKQRYVLDLALQVLAAESAGYTVRRANLLYLQPRYTRPAGADHVVQKLFRSADVTEKVRKALPRVQEQIGFFQNQIEDEGSLDLPMGTWCTQPFACPFLEQCGEAAPDQPLRLLPDLQRAQEASLQTQAIETIEQLDPLQPELTFRQRRTIQAVQSGETVVEPFVREELRAVDYPVHCVAVCSTMHVLPSFPGQRPWRRIPYAWASQTIKADGRVLTNAWTQVDGEDPRPGFIKSLADLVRSGGVILTMGHDAYDLARAFLDDLPGDKANARAVLTRRHLDLGQVLAAGVFHPDLPRADSLPELARALLDDDSVDELALQDDEQATAALQRALAPRIRATTREKTAAEVQAWVAWQARVLMDLFRTFARTGSHTVAPPSAPLPTPPKVIGRLGKSGELEAVTAGAAADAAPPPKKGRTKTAAEVKTDSPPQAAAKDEPASKPAKTAAKAAATPAKSGKKATKKTAKKATKAAPKKAPRKKA